MAFISFIMPKLAVLIPLCILFFVAYVIYQNRDSNRKDALIKENGVNIDATIVNVVYDKYQRYTDKRVAILTVQYAYNGQPVVAKRGLSFSLADEEKVTTGRTIAIRINPMAPQEYYYVHYRTY